MAAGARGIGMTSQRARNRLAEHLRTMGIDDERILDLIRSVPRHLFVDEALASRAYDNTALPIGYGQTISQPYTVAAMTAALLATGATGSILEIGAGCGYQSALLARIADRVYAVERIAALASKLRVRLHDLGIKNVRVRHGDGYEGWAEHGPFDAILVAAAAGDVPHALVSQLGDGGRMVMPVTTGTGQRLMLIQRDGNALETTMLDQVSFVPLVHGLQ